MVLGKPVEIVDDGGRPGLDAAMVAIDRRVLADLALMEVALFLLGYEQRDILVQSRLVPLERPDILGLLVAARLSNHALAATRSEERRSGKTGVCKCKLQWEP